ncbi:endonuclease/exonuclease/phosphatase family protein [Tritonibacter mobilis]|uniref:endonuclease/exonuclease/phosphatase family protein n=1 Tax=Tritonibacter mobilis TaxID=379347 RepID=UPI000E0D00AA|nr:endonuclease/exonuclease/phosphatase family protein [Tritonibacter mobilis]
MRALRIVSWNIRKAVGLDWRRDPARVLRVLESMKPDIILLQEADKRLAPRPPALPLAMVEQAGWTALDADPDTPSIGHHGNAVLFRNAFAIHDFKAIDLPGLEPRGAVLARFSGQGFAFCVGAAHFGLRRKDRILQMKHLLEEAERFGCPAVVGGDFNEWRARGRLLPDTSNWSEVAPGPSFHASSPRLLLDRFMIEANVTVLEHGVVTKGAAMKASDHLPIWIDVVF